MLRPVFQGRRISAVHLGDEKEPTTEIPRGLRPLRMTLAGDFDATLNLRLGVLNGGSIRSRLEGGPGAENWIPGYALQVKVGRR